jgi:hypothetical protein
MARLQSYGEPWTFGLYPGEIRTFLTDRGLELLKELGVDDVRKPTVRSSAGTRGYELYRLASAAWKNPELPPYSYASASTTS